MKIRYETLSQLHSFFNTSIEQSSLNFREKRKMLKIKNIMDDDAKIIQQEQVKIFDQFAQKDDNGVIVSNGNNIKLKPGTLANFTARMNDLMGTEVDLGTEVESFKFNESVFDNIKCTADALDVIDRYFIESEDKENG